ncbi:MAG: glycoside hydrolase family 15 protein [Steroidobacteraceae bacterium]
MTTPLEEYGLIGDGETAALISRQGSIDWLCLPRFDSPACCAAILGTAEHGRWSIAPEGPIERTQHHYQPGTLILETELTAPEGKVRLTDFMPIRDGNPCVVRRVTGVSGNVPTFLELAPRFDYGNMPPWVTRIAGGVEMRVGPDKIVLRGPVDFESDSGTIRSRFRIKEGETQIFILTYEASHGPPRQPIDAHAALAKTQRYWREWIERFNQPVAHAEAVRRSLLTLKALIHRPTGGLVAAPTTSLPEQPGGSMNWDYRYCWLRDATFTLSALIDCGYVEEAAAWREWILRAAAGEPEKLQIMYRVDGSRRLDEAQLPWLPGYRFARPVRVGNGAAGQLQLDVYGELLRTLHAAERAGMTRNEQTRHLELAIVKHVEQIWIKPDQGLWESRGEPRHHTYSKVMAWVALDRFLDGKGGEEISVAERTRLESLRDHLHAVICREGFDVGLGSFTSYFGGREVDASLLLLPAVGFLPASDQRMAGTIALIEKTLVVDGLVRRHLMDSLVPEGAFVACSFWLAECQLGQCRRADAVETIGRALAIRNELGMLSEEYDLAGRRLAGNYPQALSHLALIHAVLALAKFDQGGQGR